MNIEALRILLYPTGFIASLAFGGRFLIQWILSEKKKTKLCSQSFLVYFFDWKFFFNASLLYADTIPFCYNSRSQCCYILA